jgi:hypothetical protein
MKNILAFGLLFLSMSSARTCSAQEHSDQKSSGRVSLAADVFRFAGTCWFLTGTFGYEDYFADFRVRKTGDETKYLKAGNEVYDFPSRTDIVIYLETIKCASHETSSKQADASPEEWIDTAEFKVEWKRKEYLRPAKLLSFRMTKDPFSPTPTDPLSMAHKSWTATISIESLNVPLSDHLIVSMMSNGVRLARINGQVAH